MFKKQLTYFFCLLGYVLIMGYLLIVLQKGQFELFINGLHLPSADIFFKYWTYMGDGITCTFIIILLFIGRLYYGVVALTGILIQTAVVQYLKQFPFHNEPRPFAYFRSLMDVSGLNYVEGVEILEINSFPSGHTATAFCIVTLLVLFMTKETLKQTWLLQILLFFTAVLVGLSRNYLFLHFLADTYGGAFIGIIAAYMAFLIFEAIPGIKNSAFYRFSFIKKKHSD